MPVQKMGDAGGLQEPRPIESGTRCPRRFAHVAGGGATPVGGGPAGCFGERQKGGFT